MQRDEDRNLPNQLRTVNLNESDAQEPRPLHCAQCGSMGESINGTGLLCPKCGTGRWLSPNAPAAPREPLSPLYGAICPTHGMAVLVMHIDEGEPCSDYTTVGRTMAEEVIALRTELASARAALDDESRRLQAQIDDKHRILREYESQAVQLRAALDAMRREGRDRIVELSNGVIKLQAALDEAKRRSDERDYQLLGDAIEQSLAPCVVEDDVAAVAIYVEAIHTAGTAISEADDVLHTVRAQLSRDLSRKHNGILVHLCTLIDGLWEASVPFGRLHEQRPAFRAASPPPTEDGPSPQGDGT